MSPVAEYIVQAAVTLLGIGLLAFLLVFANRRWGGVPARGPLELVGRLPLEGRRAVYLVRVGDRVLVLAATDQHISKIGELDADAVPRPAAAPGGFNAVLQRLTEKTGAATTSAENAPPPEARPR